MKEDDSGSHSYVTCLKFKDKGGGHSKDGVRE
jgi:hypothetical protein